MRVAVFLPNWVGDVVMATPAVRALRESYPEARLLGVHHPHIRRVRGGCSWFDDLFPFAPRGMFAVARRLRAERIDLAVLFPNTFRSALTAWLGGCRRRIGYRRYGRGPLLTDALDPVVDARG